ncbi:MAG TPA: glycyl-radical enzyme activating protein [Desulfomonilia bacterium]|nr:glycyl-radical enzyme activating protein [Desulfomonilia bacterium]
MKHTSPGVTRKNPLIFAIKGNSLDDGPGIRTVIFFKGCPLECVWCHNPESKSTHPEIAYDPKKCIGCESCMQVCPMKAISKDNAYYIDRNLCNICYECTNECPSGALEKVGQEYPPDELLDVIMADKPFFDNSGGGVTLSGGEPTLFMHYAGELASALKDKGIHVLLETCGLFDYGLFRELLLPYLDTVYYDIKLIDDSAHYKYCGVGNSVILENFSMLVKDFRDGGIALLARTPMVPGITDTDANMNAIASFLKGCGIEKADLMPYNPLWHDKSWSMGLKDRYRMDRDMTRFLSRERCEHCREIFRAAGISI